MAADASSPCLALLQAEIAGIDQDLRDGEQQQADLEALQKQLDEARVAVLLEDTRMEMQAPAVQAAIEQAQADVGRYQAELDQMG
jgi:Asp-tRNA(Asn)/Glu-tRNA(Gln) amidotransferase A subunit family amidase